MSWTVPGEPLNRATLPPAPTASNLNYVKNQVVPNMVVAPVGACGKVALFNGSPGTVQLIADVSGCFRAGCGPGEKPRMDSLSAPSGTQCLQQSAHLGRGGHPSGQDDLLVHDEPGGGHD